MVSPYRGSCVFAVILQHITSPGKAGVFCLPELSEPKFRKIFWIVRKIAELLLTWSYRMVPKIGMFKSQYTNKLKSKYASLFKEEVVMARKNKNYETYCI